MARTVATDYLHSMRFFVVVTGAGSTATNWLKTGNADARGIPEAGFMSCTTPSMTVEPVDYKEGTWIYQRRFPGNVTMADDISMQRGVTRGDSSFWLWIRCVAEGSGEYRADLQINHMHREQALDRKVDDRLLVNTTTINALSPARVYHVYDAFPTSHKVAGDFDANTSDISLMEVTVSYERFEIEDLGNPSA